MYYSGSLLNEYKIPLGSVGLGKFRFGPFQFGFGCTLPENRNVKLATTIYYCTQKLNFKVNLPIFYELNQSETGVITRKLEDNNTVCLFVFLY